MFLVACDRRQCYASHVNQRIETSVAAVRAKKRAMGLRPAEIWFTGKQLEALSAIAEREGSVRDQVVRMLVDEALERRAMASDNTQTA